MTQGQQQKQYLSKNSGSTIIKAPYAPKMNPRISNSDGILRSLIASTITSKRLLIETIAETGPEGP